MRKLVVSREVEPEIFESTIGGYGLSGSILGCSLNSQLPITDFYLLKLVWRRSPI